MRILCLPLGKQCFLRLSNQIRFCHRDRLETSVLSPSNYVFLSFFSLFNRVLSFLWSPFTVITESAYSALTRIQELPFLFRHFWHYWLFFFLSFLFVYIITFRKLLKVPWLPAVNFPRLCCTQEIWPKHKHLIIFVTFFFEFDTNIYFNLIFFFAWGILELFYSSWLLSARSLLRCHSYKCHSLGGIFLQHFL